MSRAWPYLVLAGLVAGVTILVLWFAGRALLLVGAGLLVATFLNAVALPLRRLTGLGRAPAVVIVFAVVLGAFAALAYTLAPGLIEQARQLVGELREAWGRIADYLNDFALGRRAIAHIESSGGVPGVGIASEVWSAASVTVSGLTDLVIVSMIGLYVAVDPGVYLRGLLHLLPQERRAHARDVVLDMAERLRRWLLGQLVAMALVGTACGVGLWLLGVPQAPVLGLIAGLLDFIPNLGPILGLAPAVLVAFTQGWSEALYVVVLYAGVQALEGNVIVPLVQRRAVDLPPALTVTAQVILGLLGGILGLLLAVPLAAVTLIAIRRLWIEDHLHERS